MNRFISLCLVLFTLGVVTLTGCGGLNEAYVRADRLTYEAVTPFMKRKIAEDPTLTAEQKESKLDTLRSWNDRTSEAYKSLGIKE